MKKWYAPCSLMLVTALIAQMVGCGTTARTFSRWTGRNQADDQLAEIDGRASKAEKGSKSSKSDVKISDSSASKSKSAAEKPKGDAKIADARPGRPQATETPAETKVKESKPKSEAAPWGADPESKSWMDNADDVLLGSGKSAGSDPFADFPMDGFGSEPVAKVEPPIGSAKLSAGVLKPPSASREVAQGTQKLTPRVSTARTPAPEVSQVSATRGLPEWALEEATSTPDVPTISQAAATKIQPGRTAPPEQRLPMPNRMNTPSSPSASSVRPSTLCPAAEGEVRELVGELDSNDPESLKRTIHRLGRMQTHASAAAPGLRALLQHPDGFVRVHSALALVRMQAVSSEVTGALIIGLRSPDPGVRSFAAAVLAEMGPHSADALPALSAALNDRDGYVRLHVAEVLIRHADWSQAALQALTGSLSDRDENVRWLATYSLAELAPQSESAVDALSLALTDPVEKVQVGAAYALGEIGPLAASAVPRLERCLQSTSSELRSAAEYAVSQIRQ